MIRVLTLVFLFLVRCRFPAQLSIINVLRKRYGETLVKHVRKLEKLDFKYKKASLDLEFLLICKRQNIIPNFLKFKLANRQLLTSNAYNICQKKLLNQEISFKRKLVRTLNLKLAFLKDNIKYDLNFIDFIHITTVFLASNDRNISKIRKVQVKKLGSLCSDNNYFKSVTSHDPEKVLFNFSSHQLTEHEKSLLSRGLNFAIPPQNLNYADYLLPFELLFRDIDVLDIPSTDKDFIQGRLRDCAFTSYRDVGKNIDRNLPKEEYFALRTLVRKKDLVIQKADKGNTVVILNKADYNLKMRNILSDASKFQKLSIDKNKVLNHIVSMEKRIIEVLKNLKDKELISEKKYKDLHPVGSRPGILYGLAKIHKPTKDGVPPFRPILSDIGSPTYKLAKFFVPLLAPLTSNEYTIKDSFSFAEELLTYDSNLVMASFDVESLFTNIPLKETIDLCVDLLFHDRSNIDGISKDYFHELLNICMSESLILFDGEFYKQIDGVAMGSPLGPTFANVFLCFYEKIWLEKCPIEFKPVIYRRYVDDTFLLFRSIEQIEKFRSYLNCQHPNIKFTSEIEENNSISFLDIKITRDCNSFCTSVYRKPTFSGVFTNFESYIPLSYKTGLILTLLFRAFSLCSSFEIFHQEILKLKEIFKRNGYPSSFIDNCVKRFLDKVYIRKKVFFSVSKKELVCVLPFIGKKSLQLRSRLVKSVQQNLKFCSLKIVFQSPCKLRSLFHFKDILDKKIRSDLVYRYTCSNCNVTYYGKTYRHFFTRAAEHMGISNLTEKRVKNVKESAISDHLLQCGCSIKFDDFDILASETNNFRLLIKESLLIKRDKPILNRTIKSFPLKLFD